MTRAKVGSAVTSNSAPRPGCICKECPIRSVVSNAVLRQASAINPASCWSHSCCRRGGANVADLGARSGERDMLSGFLDWYRSVIERKVEGLMFDDASREMTPTGLSPLGVVAHLAAAEVGWFMETFAGAEVDP